MSNPIHPVRTDETTRFGRRALLGAAALGSAALLMPTRLRALGKPGRGFGPGPGPIPSGPGPPVVGKPFHRPLPIPKVLDGARLNIPIIEGDVSIFPGRKTRMWTYGGTFPGPTIRRPAGKPTTVTFEHKLPDSAGELTTHLHGGHNSSENDGQPGGLTKSHKRSLYCPIDPGLSPRESGNDLLIEPGKKRTYKFSGKEDGRAERGAMQWYHDHRLDSTAKHVWRGLAGMWIIDDPLDKQLGLPSGERDISLMIGDRSFDDQNQLTNPFQYPLHAPDDGITGEYVLVNGAVLPYHTVHAVKHRIRVLNISNFSSYNLSFGKNVPVTQIATESGLMPQSLRRERLLIGPGERIEVVVDFSGMTGESVVLRSVKRPHGSVFTGSKAYQGPLMQFRVGRPAADTRPVPKNLRPLPDWVADAPKTPSHVWKIGIGGGGFIPKWEINGRTFDPSYADAFPEIDSTVTWKLVNATAVAHLLHLHHTDWYLLERNGKKPPKHERALKETFFMDPSDELLVAGHFSDYLGKFVVHCHMIDHEDHGLMSQFEVVKKGAGPPTG